MHLKKVQVWFRESMVVLINFTATLHKCYSKRYQPCMLAEVKYRHFQMWDYIGQTQAVVIKKPQHL